MRLNKQKSMKSSCLSLVWRCIYPRPLICLVVPTCNYVHEVVRHWFCNRNSAIIFAWTTRIFRLSKELSSTLFCIFQGCSVSGPHPGNFPTRAQYSHSPNLYAVSGGGDGGGDLFPHSSPPTFPQSVATACGASNGMKLYSLHRPISGAWEKWCLVVWVCGLAVLKNISKFPSNKWYKNEQ